MGFFIHSRGKLKFVLTAVTAITLLIVSSCSSAPKKKTPELSKLEGKRVALVEIEGEATAKSVIEVALINQLVKRGTFILIPKNEIETVRKDPKVDPTDWQEIAKKAGAEFALRAKVIKFDADTSEGYSSEEVEDSQLSEERGEENAKTERLYKVKQLTGNVEISLEFADVLTHELRTGLAVAEDRFSADQKTEAAHLPPKLRFLEKLANQAFLDFFEKYN